MAFSLNCKINCKKYEAFLKITNPGTKGFCNFKELIAPFCDVKLGILCGNSRLFCGPERGAGYSGLSGTTSKAFQAGDMVIDLAPNLHIFGEVTKPYFPIGNSWKLMESVIYYTEIIFLNNRFWPRRICFGFRHYSNSICWDFLSLED